MRCAPAVAGGGVAKVNDPAVTSRNTRDVSVTTTEGCVVFQSSSSTLGPYRLYAADLHGACTTSQILFSDGFESGTLDAWTGAVP